MSPFSLTSLNKTLIVAEIGNNHEGNIEVAKEMVHAVAESGADVVKFQTFQTAYFINPENEARYQRLKGFELTYDQFAELATLGRLLISKVWWQSCNLCWISSRIFLFCLKY